MNVYVPHKDTERFLSIVQSVLLERLRREDHMWLLCGCLCPVRASQCCEFSFCIRLRENRYTGAGTRLDHCHFQRRKDIPAKARSGFGLMFLSFPQALPASVITSEMGELTTLFIFSPLLLEPENETSTGLLRLVFAGLLSLGLQS